MNYVKCLNTIGLIFGITGVVIIFLYGPPQPHFSSYILFENQSPMLELMKKEYELCSKIGLALIGVGFVFQIIAVWYRTKD